MLNIVCTSKPCDGLLYYSYEYCSSLNEKGILSQVYVITHRDFTSGDYTESISDKYIHCKDIVFNNEFIGDDDITLIMGNSMMTLAHMGWNDYTKIQQASLLKLFGHKLISVYSENHPKEYPKAREFFLPNDIINISDMDIYPNGIGKHFEKIINFDIYKEPKEEIEFEYLFLGTNKEYYETIQKVISDYPDHGILTYHQESKYLDLKNNNLRSPVKNLLGKFNTYVYTKDTWDPAPRIFQECRYFNKKIIYLRDNPGTDGGHWYWRRGIKKQNISEIISAIDIFQGRISLTTELVTSNPTKQIGSLPQADNLKPWIDRNALNDWVNNDKVWFCSIPWIMAYGDEGGVYQPCNFAQQAKETLMDTSIKDWMTGPVMENIRSEMVDPNSDFKTVDRFCSRCLNEEANLGRSKRMISNDNYRIAENDTKWPMIINAATNTMKGKPFEFKDRILEIQVKSFGIECNLDCHMCHHFSSSIRTKMAFDEGVWNDVVWGNIVEKEERSAQAMATKPVDEINDQIVELAPYIYNMKIIGGEPLIMKKHYELLDRLIKINEAKNIQLKYQTNATTTKAGKHNIFKYIPHFKTVLITVSLDGIGKYNDYIRRRSSYKEILKNMEEFSKYPNVKIELNSVATFFSVLHLYEVQSFLGQYPHHWWPIHYPDQMKANNLPQKIKTKLIPKYEKIPHLNKIVDLLKMPAEENFNAKELYKYCMDMDKSYEGTKWEMDLLNVFPELKEHYEEINNE